MNIKAYIALGWTPQLSVATDGARKVLQVTGWTGGTGTAPATGLYLGPSGFVSLIADGVDIAGASSGDMLKSTYDTDNDGVVDNAEQLGGQAGSHYLNRANHTGTQAATTITEDATHRFATDSEKTTWNSKANGSHTHAIADVTGLQTDLDNKQPLDADLTAIAGLTPTNDDVIQRKAGAWVNRTPSQLKTDLGLSNVDNTSDLSKPISTATQTALDGKANSTHSHAISDVTGLQTALDGKAASSHGHIISDVTGLQTALDGKSATGHTHTASNITDFNTAADTRADGRIAASSINALSDVTITTPSIGQVIKWNGSAWVNDTDATGGGSGDMSKSTYDTDNDGVVDNSELLNSQPGSHYLDRANHTGSQAATTITEDSTHRFVSDTEKTTWNGKANASHTHVASDITDFNTAADGRIAAASVNALSDVTITTPSIGQVLKWNGSAWVNDTDSTGGGGGTPAGTSGEIQYNNAGAFGGAANVKIEGGNLKLVSTTDPTAPTSSIIIYSKVHAGRHLPEFIGPSGVNSALQSGFHGNSIFMFGPASGTTAPVAYGGTLTTGATMSFQQTIASANPWLARAKKRYQTSATAGTTTGVYTGYTQWYFGNAAGYGGFFFRGYFGHNINLNGGQKFFGMCNSTAGLGGNPSTLFHIIGCGYDSTDADTGNWFFMRNDGTGTATKVDLGTGAARSNTTHGYELMMFAAPNSQTLYVRILNLHTNTVVLDTSYTTDLPAVNTGLSFKGQVRNGAVASADNIEVATVYIESDF